MSATSSLELSKLSLEELKTNLSGLNSDYMMLRGKYAMNVSAETGTQKRKVKKAIARTLTRINTLRLAERVNSGEKLPKCLRPKLTKKLRLQLTPAQKGLKTPKALKRERSMKCLPFTL